jgi:hypothetical protein
MKMMKKEVSLQPSLDYSKRERERERARARGDQTIFFSIQLSWSGLYFQIPKGAAALRPTFAHLTMVLPWFSHEST